MVRVPFRSVEGECKMRTRWLAGVIILGALASSGCTSSGPYKSYSEEIDSWSYPKHFGITCADWVKDLADVVSVEVGAGETIGLDLQPTEILQVGFVFGDVMKLGWRNRGLGFYREVQTEGGLSWGYYRSRRFEPIIGTASLFERPRLFEGFPIRDNNEWHWADIGGEVGLVFCDASAHVSPKKALDFCVSTVMLPFNLIFRYPLTKMGMRIPEIDLCDDDTPAEIRKKYQLELIKNPAGFEPTEVLNDLWKVPY